MTDEEIKQKAEELLLETDQDKSLPIDTEKIAAYLGYDVLFFNPDSNTKDISGAVNHSEKVIYLNNLEPPVRLNFTLAHEIAHIVLHPQEDHMDFRGHKKDFKEREADQFAGNLLMPERLFIKIWEKTKGDLKEISRQCRVSTIAVAVRANILGLDEWQ